MARRQQRHQRLLLDRLLQGRRDRLIAQATEAQPAVEAEQQVAAVFLAAEDLDEDAVSAGRANGAWTPPRPSRLPRTVGPAGPRRAPRTRRPGHSRLPHPGAGQALRAGGAPWPPRLTRPGARSPPPAGGSGAPIPHLHGRSRGDAPRSRLSSPPDLRRWPWVPLAGCEPATGLPTVSDQKPPCLESSSGRGPPLRPRCSVNRPSWDRGVRPPLGILPLWGQTTLRSVHQRMAWYESGGRAACQGIWVVGSRHLEVVERH
jgi:hypothetical protein